MEFGHSECAKRLELGTDSVFLVGIRLVFLGFYQTNTGGKLGWYIHFGIIILAGTPFFFKRGVTAPFFRGPAPILRKKGFPAKPLRVPAKFFSAQNTDQNTNQPAPVYGKSIPILAKLPVSKRYPTLQTMSLIKEYPGKIAPFSQIQKMMKLWAVIFNREIPPRVVAGHFKERLALPSKKYT